jgi:hypothetical protein
LLVWPYLYSIGVRRSPTPMQRRYRRHDTFFSQTAQEIRSRNRKKRISVLAHFCEFFGLLFCVE